MGNAILSDSVSPTISVAPSLWRDNAIRVFTFGQFSPSGISYTIRILGGTMEKTKRDWHQIAAQLRTETDSDKILELALELEGATENDSSYSPRTQARAKWGQWPHLMEANLERN